MEQAVTRRNVLVIATVLGLFAATLVYVYIRRTAPENGAKVPVAFATQDIAPRTILEPGMVEVRDMPGPQARGTCTGIGDVIGKVAVTPLARGQAITPAQVQVKSVALGLAYEVEPGMRAVTVALDPIIGVAGFLKPGDHVDVLATFSANGGTVTKTVLQNQKLLATGAQVYQNVVDTSGKGSKSEPVPNATLSVSPLDAEKLTLAESKGKLRLALRGIEDVVRVRTAGVTSRSLIGYVPADVSPAAGIKPTAQQKKFGVPPYPVLVKRAGPGHTLYGKGDWFQMSPPPQTTTIKVIRGSSVTEETVPRSD